MAAKKTGGFNAKKAAKKSGNVYAGYEIKTDEYVNSGSYTLNAALSGDVFKGVPCNLVIMYAGEEAVGKTYVMMREAYQLKLQGYHIFYFDSEAAVHDGMFEMYGFEKDEYTIMPVHTVEDARKEMFSLVDDYNEYIEHEGLKRGTKAYEERDKVAFFLDSLGNLTSNKSIADTRSGKDTKDMSKQQALKRLFSDLTVPLAMAGIPLNVSNHVYEQIGAWVPTKTVGGGSGGKYNASIILMMRKKDIKDKKTKECVGSEITVKVKKSRFVRPNLEIKFYLDYERGMMPWYGLGEIAEKAGLIKKVKKGVANHYLIQDPNKAKEDWISVPCADIDRKNAIGTILEPLNEWIKENFILKTDLDALDDDELNLDGVLVGDEDAADEIDEEFED